MAQNGSGSKAHDSRSNNGQDEITRGEDPRRYPRHLPAVQRRNTPGRIPDQRAAIIVRARDTHMYCARRLTSFQVYLLVYLLPYLAKMGKNRKIVKSYRRKTKEARNTAFLASFVGADSQIRTGDLILTKDALYLLSYISKFYAPHNKGHSGDREGT